MKRGATLEDALINLLENGTDGAAGVEVVCRAIVKGADVWMVSFKVCAKSADNVAAFIAFWDGDDVCANKGADDDGEIEHVAETTRRVGFRYARTGVVCNLHHFFDRNGRCFERKAEKSAAESAGNLVGRISLSREVDGDAGLAGTRTAALSALHGSRIEGAAGKDNRRAKIGGKTHGHCWDFASASILLGVIAVAKTLNGCEPVAGDCLEDVLVDALARRLVDKQYADLFVGSSRRGKGFFRGAEHDSHVRHDASHDVSDGVRLAVCWEARKQSVDAAMVGEKAREGGDL